MEFKRLVLGAGLTAALFGAVTAPAAFANPATPDAGVCTTSDEPTGLPVGGEGIVVNQATDDATGITCAYTSSGKAAQYVVATASKWTITVNGVAVASGGDTVNSSGAPVANGALTPAAGDVVELVVESACDPSGALCGASVDAVIGAQ